MKYLVASLIAFSFSNSYAGGSQLIKKVFKCSNLADYNVYIVKLSGITNSYKVKAFCLDTNDENLQACLEDEDDDTNTCYGEFNNLNPLKAGDGDLTIVHGR